MCNLPLILCNHIHFSHSETFDSDTNTLIIETELCGDIPVSATIAWLKDQLPLGSRNNQKYTFVNKHDGTLKLLVHNPTQDDVGSYTCSAETESHEPIDKITHHISARSLRSLELSQPTKAPKDKTQSTPNRQPISFESFLKNMTIEEGTSTKFICSIRGPFTSAVWTKDGDVICANDRYHPGRTEGLVWLEIKDVNPSDSGNFAVCISNNINDMSSNAQLNVYPNHALRSKELSTQPTPQTSKGT